AWRSRCTRDRASLAFPRAYDDRPAWPCAAPWRAQTGSVARRRAPPLQAWRAWQRSVRAKTGACRCVRRHLRAWQLRATARQGLPMHSLPIFLRLSGRPVILLGEGEARAAKARLLERAGAEIVN